MSHTPKIDPLTDDQRRAMGSELADLRLRAEHGLLKRLALQADRAPMSAGELAESIQALAALSR